MHYVVVLALKKNDLIIADPNPMKRVSKITYEQFQGEWTGIALLMKPSTDYRIIKEDKDHLWRVGRYLLQHKFLVLTISLTAISCTLIVIFGAYFLQQIVDVYVPHKELNTLNIISMGLLVLYVFYGIFTFVNLALSALLGKLLAKDVALGYIDHLLHLPLKFFSTRKNGELISRFFDANNIISVLAVTSISTILNIGTVIAIGIALLGVSPKLSLIPVVIVPIYLLIAVTFFGRFDQLNKKRMEQNALLSSEMIEDIRGIESIKAAVIEDSRSSHAQKNYKDLLATGFKYGETLALQSALKNVSQLIIAMCVLFVGAKMVISGGLKIGQLVAFNSLLGYFMNPIGEIIGIQNNLQTAKVANARLNQVLFASTEKMDDGDRTFLPSQFHTIQLDKVSFQYKYGQEVLHEIELTVNRGDSIAIVGPSGSGKSTLAKTMVNFYSPSSGTIRINGHPAGEYSKATLRKGISYLPQTPYIFAGTVIENIALGADGKDIQLDEIMEAARIADIDSDIRKLPSGYHTNLTENAGLSEGQLQRIAIARLVINKAPVMILDESTSNLDLETERTVTKNLIGLTDKTLIFIAHRLEIAQEVQRVLVMSGGRIIESGTHEQLINVQGAYTDLCKGHH